MTVRNRIENLIQEIESIIENNYPERMNDRNVIQWIQEDLSEIKKLNSALTFGNGEVAQLL